MASLDRNLRSELENAVKKARRVSENAARDAIQQLAVHHHEPWPSLSPADRQLRNRLRAHGRQLGDSLDERKGTQGVERLVTECAYEHWHRLLFARFLAENDLLIEPDSGMPLSLEECRELARERGVDWLALASGFAQTMLPQIFRATDPVLELSLPAERRQDLEAILESLPHATFTAEDSLGWVYQYWQSDRKDAVNASKTKIGAEELAPVTQLFTEDYMVLFLLHNTLGAWWAAKRKSEGKEHRLPDYDWAYLRLKVDGSPAAGAYERWPREARNLKVLDPCMGSGHFLVFALPILVGMRIEEEGLSKEAAIDAVIAENLYGLELDPRCTQIAAFNLALAAWKMGGYRALPSLNLACAGLGINAREEDWVKLAGRDGRLQRAMRELYGLFEQAPILGSLIDPKRNVAGDLLTAGFEEVQGLLEKALAAEGGDDFKGELAVTAKGLLRAARILAGEFTLVATNPPYLVRAKQNDALRNWCEERFGEGAQDLATVFIQRCEQLCSAGGSHATVTPQNWLFLGNYKTFRENLITTNLVHVVGRVGSGARAKASWDVLRALVIASKARATDYPICGVAAPEPDEAGRAAGLRNSRVEFTTKTKIEAGPDTRLAVREGSAGSQLSEHADSFAGLQTGDSQRFARLFWEVPLLTERWAAQQTTTSNTALIGGCCMAVLWEEGEGQLSSHPGAYVRGGAAWGKAGVAVTQTRALPVARYLGTLFDNNTAAIIPKRPEDLSSIWAFCESEEFNHEVRRLDEKLGVTNATLAKVPFDLERWRKLAAEKYPDGLPRPSSTDPTQWVFCGHPSGAAVPLHVAVARLVGYRWPRQTGSTFMGCAALSADGLEQHTDADGIVCLASLRGERSAADRLMELLAKAYGADWSAETLAALLRQVEASSLEEWLRNRYFEQHCRLFHQRPFVWQVWDGLADGFSALVSYHKLTGPKGEGRRTLESLVYKYVGEWIARRKADVASDVDGADLKLTAAVHLKEQLENILTGEPPYDIFVRWKPLREQPVGWDPDVEDGVKINIRPFMNATPFRGRGTILRSSPSIKWGKDKGTEPERPEFEYPWFWGWDGTATDFLGGSKFDGGRWNDLHYSRDVKLSATRERRRGAKS